MARQGKGGIAWTDETWNVVTGCTPVSEGCRNCYAERMAKRRMAPEWKKNWRDYIRGNPKSSFQEYVERPRRFTDILCHPKRLDIPLHWRKPRKVFVCSMGDLFHDRVPDEFIESVLRILGLAQRHTFQILTKRPGRMLNFCVNRTAKHSGEIVPNLWLGVSVEDQHTADERIPMLLQTPAAVRFVSCEPMLGPVNLATAALSYKGENSPCRWGKEVWFSVLDWVIVGGETGPGARPMDPDWARDVRDQCRAARVPFFFKNMSGRQPIPEDLMIREFPA